MPYDPDDLGLDLLHAQGLPECMACRKKSDGAVTVTENGVVTILCGTHHDEWRRETRSGTPITAAGFAADLRFGHYRACWEATIE